MRHKTLYERFAMGIELMEMSVVHGMRVGQCATLAAGPGPEASENLVGPVRN